eukprot:2764377-Pleurochrysis_carterae.AAC.1
MDVCETSRYNKIFIPVAYIRMLFRVRAQASIRKRYSEHKVAFYKKREVTASDETQRKFTCSIIHTLLITDVRVCGCECTAETVRKRAFNEQ